MPEDGFQITSQKKKVSAFTEGCEVKNENAGNKAEGGVGVGRGGEGLFALSLQCEHLKWRSHISSKRTPACDKYNFTEEVASDKRFVRGGKVLIRHNVAERTQPSQQKETVKNEIDKGRKGSTQINGAQRETISHVYRFGTPGFHL